MNADGKRYVGYVNGQARTYPNTTVGGSTHYYGGSHGGRGGFADQPSAETYDSLYFPNEPGGSGTLDGSTCSTCAPGGGVIRLHAPKITIDGLITANGVSDSNAGGGAGGTILLDGDRV